MAYKLQDVENAGLSILNDETGIVWKPLFSLRWINQGIRLVASKRSSALFNSAGTLITITDASSLDAALPIDDRFLLPLSHFHAYMCLLKEGRNEFDESLANIQKQRFLETLKDV
jgi:hypothetical protein